MSLNKYRRFRSITSEVEGHWVFLCDVIDYSQGDTKLRTKVPARPSKTGLQALKPQALKSKHSKIGLEAPRLKPQAQTWASASGEPRIFKAGDF